MRCLRTSAVDDIGHAGRTVTHLGTIPGAFDAVPNTTTNHTHGESTTEIVQNDIRAELQIVSYAMYGSRSRDTPRIPCVITVRHGEREFLFDSR